ncbi:MAG TPA: hypothetical protein VM487_02880, partial [Phycisphaerae bacterium]|nr:hypothetical protein [Phycisphaerae bacterium]
MKSSDKILAWHFLTADCRLRNGGEVVEVGKTYSVPDPDKPLVLCEYGMHASARPLDALNYAPGPMVCRVEMSGTILEGDDKLVATHRKVLALADALDVLRKFARLCALDVIHLWDAPDVVRRYLETGDESLRAAARATAEDAAWATARDAAWDAGAAWDAAWDAARSTEDAAEDAARAAAWV